MENLTLILGGASSGKSAYAEQLVLGDGRSPLYIATAKVQDAEMTDKVARHRARRGSEWRLIEAPMDLVSPLKTCTSEQVILLDCLTLWLSNLMEAKRDIEAETTALLAAIEASSARVIAVSNELGLGLVPASSLGRRFRDAQGQLNQRFAKAALNVTFVAAGLPLCLKGAI